MKECSKFLLLTVFQNGDIDPSHSDYNIFFNMLQNHSSVTLFTLCIHKGAFWRPIDQDQVLTTWSRGRQNDLVLNLRLCDVTARWPVNQILTSNNKATINRLKWLVGFKSILYLMPSTQHTQACVFIKITVRNWFFFTSGH